MTATPTLAEAYARFTAGLDWAALPGPVQAMALDLWADWFANAAAGLGSPLAQALAGLGRQPGPAVVVGTLAPAAPLEAALINAAAAHALEFDDSHRAGLYHPGAPTIAAALAAAGRAGASGREFLAGLVAGYEVSLRLALAVNPGHYRTWHTTGTVGVFGAAAAAGRCLGLGPEACAGALGLAGTQAAGLWEVLPQTPQAKNLHPAKAAHGGLLAALLAQRSILGPTTILEGPRGFFAGFTPQPVDQAACLSGLGQEWLILQTTIKAYPVCGHTMTPLEAALELHGRFAADQVAGVEVRAHPVSVQVAGQAFPEDEYQAKFSIPYCVAVALLRGRVSQAEFGPQVRRSRELLDLLGRIELRPDETLDGRPGRRPAAVTVHLADGRVLTASAEVRRGDPERPLTPEDKKDKFLGLAGQVWGRAGAERLWASVREIDQAADVSAWAERCRGLGN